MALLVTGVNVKTRTGDVLTGFWIDVQSRLAEKPTPKILVSLKAYRTEADYDAGYQQLNLEDTGAGLATDVPARLHSIVDILTPVQYANVDMTQVHNQLRDLLIQGDSHARWDELIEAGVVWAGFGVGNVSREMPA